MDQRKEYPPLRAPKTFNLSVDAAIFIPKTITPKEEQSPYQQCQPQPPSHVHQQRFAHAQGGVEPGGGDGGGGGSSGYDYASQLAHGGGAGPMANGVDVMKMSAVQSRISNMQISDGDAGKELGDRKSEALDYLTAVIAELYDNPGMFDEVKEKLPKELGDMAQDQDVLSSAIEMIFNQSIQESNFRYMGARLCQLLDSLDQRPESLVRRLLELKMDDLERVALPEYMKQEQVKVRGATLFLAELYMQLRNPGQALGKTISEHIISAIEILLIKHGSENIKCVCQSLKLCGFELEQDCPDKVESILKTLEQLKVQSSAEAMIHSVLDLRKISWGRSEEIATSAAPPPPMQGGSTGMHHMPAGIDLGPGFHDSPVFYGPDGQVLTEEESSFLETNGFVLPTKGRFDDSDDELGLDEQDLEIQEAYADFLESNRSNQQQQHQQQQPGV
uniref:MIF4G domain-containing protein n=1 Tax=Anopheles farauti TaxID=69004 RepID=A0A182QX68_9DIPT